MIATTGIRRIDEHNKRKSGKSADFRRMDEPKRSNYATLG